MKPVLVISAHDNVATALEPLEPGRQLSVNGHSIIVREAVAAGHKIAMRSITAGESVIKYGSAIGIATTEIHAGDHVHTHNVASTRGRGDLAASRPATNAMRLAEPPDGAAEMDGAGVQSRDSDEPVLPPGRGR